MDIVSIFIETIESGDANKATELSALISAEMDLIIAELSNP